MNKKMNKKEDHMMPKNQGMKKNDSHMENGKNHKHDMDHMNKKGVKK